MIDGRWLRVPIQTNRPPLLERKGREPEDVKRLAYDEPPPAEVYPEPTPEQVAAATARPVRRGQPFVEVVCGPASVSSER